MTHRTREFDVTLSDGRSVHVWDVLPEGSAGDLPVLWHHGTPNIGAPPEPLFAASARLGIRWLAFDRPSYGSSTPLPGRYVASAAECAAAAADAVGIDRFAVMGHSGGAPHALACAALLPERVTAAVGVASLAPYGASGLDWFAGMYPGGEATLRAAADGRDARARHEDEAEFDPGMFTASDEAALAGVWSWFMSVVGPAQAQGPDGAIDDDVAYVTPWGFDPAAITVPVLLVHGEDDHIAPVTHAEWLAARIPDAELWRRPGEGHISALTAGEDALSWLASCAWNR